MAMFAEVTENECSNERHPLVKGDNWTARVECLANWHLLYIIIIIHEFHRDASLETKLQGRYVSRITLQL